MIVQLEDTMNANDLYGKRRQETLDKLAELHRLLCEKSDAAQAKTPTHYTHAGSLGHVAARGLEGVDHGIKHAIDDLLGLAFGQFDLV